jgi:trigger factor
MQIEVTELEPCKLSVKYEAGAFEILNKRGEILNAFKKAPVPGFREGKATIDVIKVHYRQQIEESLKRALAEDAYHNTLFEKKIRPHGAPKFNTLLLADGKFTCDFELYTKPDFELAPFKEMEVPKPHASHTAVEVGEQMLQELRVRFGDVVPYSETDFVQMGDNVIVDYEGSVDGTVEPNLSATGEMITMGRSSVPQFDSNLLGMTLGEVREFDMVVPENGLPSLSGKTVHMKATLVMGSKTTPCALDDELAKKLGKKDYPELRDFVFSTAGARLENESKMMLTEAVAVKMVDDNKFSVPNWMSLSEAQYLAHQSKLDWATLPDSDKEKYMELAEKNVKLSLILDKIREVEPEAQLSDQEVFEVIKQNLAHTQVQKPIDDIIKEMNRTGYLQILFSRIRDENTLDFVVKKAKVIE